MNTLTEEEAKTKWCPHTGSHEGGHHPTKQSCIGSACMSWRWESYASRDNPTRAPGAGHSFDLTRGFCGLAGRP